MIVRSRRLATTLALALAAGGMTIAVAGPAQAIPIGCNGYLHSDTVAPGLSITATYFLACTGGNRPLPVVIWKNGTEVATGTGAATYTCVGSASNDFSTNNGLESFYADCG